MDFLKLKILISYTLTHYNVQQRRALQLGHREDPGVHALWRHVPDLALRLHRM
jgi:hypothetical protein